ncbi:hypothetical protein Tsubulata_008386 [Turnera subulata]|uniref:Acyltransferase n=1 Tax=Turnera subulata TaxID=218843 RepID=A0A9Q0J6K2_9ROSI|nr:hypothetical protein Tsubulata_008386 [Turnera subulata]
MGLESRWREEEREGEDSIVVYKTEEIFRSSVGERVVALGIWLGSVHLIFALLLFTLLFLPFSKSLLVFGLLLMLIFIPIDHQNKWGRCLARFICRHACTYFPVHLHVEDIKAFRPDRAYVFGYEPHSVWPIGIVALADLTGLLPLPKIKALASTARKTNNAFCFGYFYSFSGLDGEENLSFAPLIAFLNARTGFIRIAMQNGSPLVPVFCFGQSNVYKWWKPSGELFLKFARSIKFTPIVFWGKFGSPLPFPHPMHVVIGRPIELKKSPQPTMEEVVDVQKQFIAALKDTFERHKERVGYTDLQLQIL